MDRAKPKSVAITVTFSPDEMALVKHAAVLQDTNLVNFIRQQAIESAENAFHEQSSFVVSEKQWKIIEGALEKPARVLPNLRKLLAIHDDCDK